MGGGILLPPELDSWTCGGDEGGVEEAGGGGVGGDRELLARQLGEVRQLVLGLHDRVSRLEGEVGTLGAEIGEMEADMEKYLGDQMEDMAGVVNMSVDRLDHLYQFTKSEVGGLGVKVETGVGVMRQAAMQMRGEVRGNSSILKGVCEGARSMVEQCKAAPRN